ncbi:hypothetical protein K0M31_000027 [Melipona bicolor]|uniref:Uncharacterized protein n=1 Tax=Melipona bicolor TaxID=60889 RepID=A0AA40GCN9_9HYME|nr:hypothetical protein K0M31_000027 [Melipona bicolor]
MVDRNSAIGGTGVYAPEEYRWQYRNRKPATRHYRPLQLAGESAAGKLTRNFLWRKNFETQKSGISELLKVKEFRGEVPSSSRRLTNWIPGPVVISRAKEEEKFVDRWEGYGKGMGRVWEGYRIDSSERLCPWKLRVIAAECFRGLVR